MIIIIKKYLQWKVIKYVERYIILSDKIMYWNEPGPKRDEIFWIVL